MAIVPPNPYNVIEGMQGIARMHKTNAERRAINQRTQEFINTQESRERKQRAENIQATQAAEMSTESNKNIRDKGLHVEGTEAAARKGIQQSKTETKKSAQAEDFYDYNAITDEASHRKAVYARLQDGESLEDIQEDILDHYDEDWIAVRRARAAETPETLLQQGKDAASMERTRAQVAATITSAQINANSRMQAAVLRGKAAASQGLPADIGESPFKREDFIAQSLSASEAAMKKGYLGTSIGSGAGLEDHQVKANAERMAAAASDMAKADEARWNLALQQGIKLPDNLHPDVRRREYSRRAQAIVLGTVAPSAGLTPQEVAAEQHIILEARIPNSPYYNEIQAMALEFRLSHEEITQILARRKVHNEGLKNAAQ